MSRGFTLSSTVMSSDTVLVRVRGALGVGIADDLGRQVSPYLRAGRRRRVCIDASEAHHIDEAALDALVDLARELRRAGGCLTVRGVSCDKLSRASRAVDSTLEVAKAGMSRSPRIASVNA